MSLCNFSYRRDDSMWMNLFIIVITLCASVSLFLCTLCEHLTRKAS